MPTISSKSNTCAIFGYSQICTNQQQKKEIQLKRRKRTQNSHKGCPIINAPPLPVSANLKCCDAKIFFFEIQRCKTRTRHASGAPEPQPPHPVACGSGRGAPTPIPRKGIPQNDTWPNTNTGNGGLRLWGHAQHAGDMRLAHRNPNHRTPLPAVRVAGPRHQSPERASRRMTHD